MGPGFPALLLGAALFGLRASIQHAFTNQCNQQQQNPPLPFIVYRPRGGADPPAATSPLVAPRPNNNSTNTNTNTNTTVTTNTRPRPKPSDACLVVAAQVVEHALRLVSRYQITAGLLLLWATKAWRPAWGQSDRSFDVTREVINFTPGTRGLRDASIAVFSSGLVEHRAPKRLTVDGLVRLMAMPAACTFAARTVLGRPDFPLVGSAGFKSLLAALACSTLAPTVFTPIFLPWAYYFSYRDWREAHTPEQRLTAILQGLMVTAVARERGSGPVPAVEVRIRPLRLTPVAPARGKEEGYREEEGGLVRVRRMTTTTTTTFPRRRGYGNSSSSSNTSSSMPQRKKARRRQRYVASNMKTIHVGAASRPSSLPPGGGFVIHYCLLQDAAMDQESGI